jgi:hypothetical protein
MNLDHKSFADIVRYPQLNKIRQNDLQEFVKHYPYCAPASLALLRITDKNCEEYSDLLFQTAIRCSESISLYRFLNNRGATEEIKSSDDKDETILHMVEHDQKTEIIDKFLQAEPRIIPRESEFEAASELARKSNEDSLNFVSETLADIYVKQGNKLKAIKIYEQLSLNNPEKSAYFATLIENLKQ